MRKYFKNKVIFYSFNISEIFLLYWLFSKFESFIVVYEGNAFKKHITCLMMSCNAYPLINLTLSYCWSSKGISKWRHVSNCQFLFYSFECIITGLCGTQAYGCVVTTIKKTCTALNYFTFASLNMQGSLRLVRLTLMNCDK